jgi:hypothetical protein
MIDVVRSAYCVARSNIYALRNTHYVIYFDDWSDFVTISGPRLRSILRRAEKVAKSGKYSAAATLYRQLTEEAPEVAAGWLGLAAVTGNTAEKEKALSKALALEPENQHARYLQALLRGETWPADGQEFPIVPPAPSIVNKETTVLEEMAKEEEKPPSPKPARQQAEEVAKPKTAESKPETAESLPEPEPEPKPEPQPPVEAAAQVETAEAEPDDVSQESERDADEVNGRSQDQPWFVDYDIIDDDVLQDHLDELLIENDGLSLDTEAGPEMVCYRHPKRETSLRCYSCERYICSQCAIKTPVGYRCPVCVREAEDVFFNANALDYVVAPIVALPLSVMAGFLVLSLGSGFLMILIIFFLAGLIGGFIGRAAKWAVGRRRGRYLAHIVAACVAMGVIIPGLDMVVRVIFSDLSFFVLLGPGIYLFIAVSAAFYNMK